MLKTDDPSAERRDVDHRLQVKSGVCMVLEMRTMRFHSDLVELARICLEQAAKAKNKAVAAELRRMADDYQRRAGQLRTSRPLLAASTEQSRPVVQQQQQVQPKKDD